MSVTDPTLSFAERMRVSREERAAAGIKTERKVPAGSVLLRAIKAKCHECVGDENPRADIGGCTSGLCPLHPYRPYRADA